MIPLLVILESGLGGDGREEVILVRRRSTEDLLRGLIPSDRLLEVALLLVVEEAYIDKNLDEFGETRVSQSPSRIRISNSYRHQALDLMEYT